LGWSVPVRPKSRGEYWSCCIDSTHGRKQTACFRKN
jgi:hypothetical protein